MSFDAVRNLAGEPGWRRALPGWLLAALSRRAGLSDYFFSRAHSCSVVVCTLNLVLYARAFWMGRKRSQ